MLLAHLCKGMFVVAIVSLWDKIFLSNSGWPLPQVAFNFFFERNEIYISHCQIITRYSVTYIKTVKNFYLILQPNFIQRILSFLIILLEKIVVTIQTAIIVYSLSFKKETISLLQKYVLSHWLMNLRKFIVDNSYDVSMRFPLYCTFKCHCQILTHYHLSIQLLICLLIPGTRELLWEAWLFFCLEECGFGDLGLEKQLKTLSRI